MKKEFACLILVFFISRLLVAAIVPMKLDECLYAVMIEEQLKHPTLVPTFFGYEVGWKPPLFFWLAGVVAALFKPLQFLPLDAVYRLPNIVFGFASLCLFYLIVKQTSKNEKLALVASFIFALTPLVIYNDASALTDTLCLTFILASVYAYLKAENDERLFILAGIFSFLAFFTKQVNALVAPLVALAYFFQNNKKILRKPMFLVSLLFVPAAFLLNYFVYADKSQAAAVFSDLITSKIFEKLGDPLFLLSSFFPFFMLSGVWFCLSLIGFVKNWKKDLMFGVWYALMIFPLIGGTWMPWYFMPVMPAVAYFAAKAMAENEKREMRFDRFFYIVFAFMLAAALLLGATVFYNLVLSYGPEKEAGEFLAFKENVLIIGEYKPGIFAYKMLEENRRMGEWLDFGYVILQAEAERRVASDRVEPFIEDYYGPGGGDIVDGNFGSMFFENKTYRKDTAPTKFDYIALVRVGGPRLNGTLVFNESGIEVYDVRE